jgi:hypothetical protein
MRVYLYAVLILYDVLLVLSEIPAITYKYPAPLQPEGKNKLVLNSFDCCLYSFLNYIIIIQYPL